MTKRIIRKTTAVLSACMFACMIFMKPAEAEGWYDENGNWVEKSVPAVIAVNPYAGGWSNCTWSAWHIALEQTGIALPEWGMAGNWLSAAAQDGYFTSKIPAAGSIIVWSGHVGYVMTVSQDGQSVYVLEGGHNGGYNEGWYPAYGNRYSQQLLGYIYLH